MEIGDAPQVNTTANSTDELLSNTNNTGGKWSRSCIEIFWIGRILKEEYKKLLLSFYTLFVILAFSYDQLKNISTSLIESTQTGELGKSINLTIELIEVSEPIKDPEFVIYNINTTCKYFPIIHRWLII